MHGFEDILQQLSQENSYWCVLRAADTLKTIFLLLNWKTRKYDLRPLRLTDIFLCDSFIIMSLNHYVLTYQAVHDSGWVVFQLCAHYLFTRCACVHAHLCDKLGQLPWHWVETKQMSAGAGSAWDRAASERYAWMCGDVWHDAPLLFSDIG